MKIAKEAWANLRKMCSLPTHTLPIFNSNVSQLLYYNTESMMVSTSGFNGLWFNSRVSNHMAIHNKRVRNSTRPKVWTQLNPLKVNIRLSEMQLKIYIVNPTTCTIDKLSAPMNTWQFEVNPYGEEQ